MPARPKPDFAAAGIVMVQGPAGRTRESETQSAVQRRWREIALGSLVVLAAGVICFFVVPLLAPKPVSKQPVVAPLPAAAESAGAREQEELREVKENP